MNVSLKFIPMMQKSGIFEEVFKYMLKKGTSLCLRIYHMKEGEVIEFLSESERLAKAINQDFYERYHEEFIDIHQGIPAFKAPVIRIKATQGESTYMLLLYPTYLCGNDSIKGRIKEGWRKIRYTIYPYLIRMAPVSSNSVQISYQ